MASSALTSMLRSLGVGVIGGLVFQLAGMPLAWMLGPLVANLVVSVRGIDVDIPEWLRGLFLGVLGMVLGSQVTPALAHRVVDWPLSAGLLLLGVFCSTALASAWYRYCGFDRVSAWFAAAPGAMTAMVLMADKVGGDPQRISVAQSLRVILVILILPPLFWAFEGAAPSGAASAGVASDNPPRDLWLLLLLPLIISLGRWLRLPTPALLAPLFVAVALGIAGTASLQLPGWGMNVMLWVLGSAIGSRFKGVSGRRLGRYAWQAGVATALALCVLAVFAELIHRAVGVPRDVALLALAPGGIGEMAIVAVALGLDPMFVAFHHLLRMVVLMIVAPLWARWLSRHAHDD